MPIYEATLTKTLSDGTKHYIYPKTNASVVKYGSTNVGAVLTILQADSSTKGSVDYKIAQYNTNTVSANYVLKTTVASSSALGLVKIGSNVSIDANGVISIAAATTSAAGVVRLNDTVDSNSANMAATANSVKTAYDAAVTIMGASSSSAAGSTGRVPAPSAGDQVKFLRGDATWAIPYTHPTHTATTGVETTNQSVTLGSSVKVSQVTSDASGHVTSQTERTITFTHPTYTAQTGVASTNQTPAFGGTFNIDQFTSDGTGHINGRTTRTVTIPATVMGGSSSSAAGSIGLVPAPAKGDHAKFLRGDATWATPYTHPSYTATTGIETANQSVTLGSSVNVSQVATDATGHVTSQTTRTITFTHPTYTAQTGVATGNQTPAFGSAFNIDQFTSDGTGHISGRTTRTVTIPATQASSSTFGLVKIGTNVTVSSGVISIANASTSAKGVVQLVDSVASTSNTMAPSA